jgi:hypothetical protein
MASEKLQYKQIADPKLLNPLIEDFKELNKLLEVTEKNLKETLSAATETIKKSSASNVKSLNNTEEAINEVKKSVKGLEDVEKAKENNDKRIKQLTDEQIKQKLLLQKANKEQRDRVKEMIELENKSIGTLKRLNIENKKLRKERENLNFATEEGSKRLIEINKQLDENNSIIKDSADAFKKQKLEVGGYSEGILDAVSKLQEVPGATGAAASGVQGLGAQLKALLANPVVLVISAIVAGLSALFAAFKKTAFGADFFAKAGAFLQGIVSELVGFVDKLRIGLQSAFEDPKQALIDFGNAIVDNLVNRFKGLIDLFNAVGKGLKALWEQDLENLKEAANEAGTAIVQMTTGFDEEQQQKIADFTKEVLETANAFAELTEEQRKLIRLNREREKSLARITKAQEEQLAIQEDDTRGFEERAVAAEKAAKLLEERALLELKIARANLNILQKEIKLRKSNGEDIEQLLDAEKEATLALIDAEKDLSLTRLDNAEKRRRLVQDTLERDLDILIDGLDNQKSINERIIASEKETFAERFRLQKRTEKIFKDSFDAQVATIQTFTDKQIDINDLLAEDDARLLNQKIRNLELSEIMEGRLLEVIRDRRTGVQDLIESENDLNDALRDSLITKGDVLLTEQALIELRKEGANVEEILDKLAEDRAEKEIELLRERLAQAKEGSAEYLSINKQLNDALLAQFKDRLSEEETEEDDSLKRRAENRKLALEAISELNEKYFDDKIEKIEEEIEAEEKRAEQLRELAAQGNEDAQNNLALTQKRQAEAELERERQLKRQKQSELALASIQAYSQKVTAGEENPLASTITDISVLSAFIQSLPAFFGGSERVGDDLDAVLSGRDGHIIRVDGDERILSPSQNAMIPREMSNMELAIRARDSVSTNQRSSTETALLVEEIRQLRKVTEERPQFMGVKYDEITKSLVDHFEQKGRLEKVHKKTGSIWGN